MHLKNISSLLSRCGESTVAAADLDMTLMYHENFKSPLSGNKVYKLYHWLNRDDLERTVLSSGGIQSNAMYAISELCRLKQLNFVYFCERKPDELKSVDEESHCARIASRTMFIHDKDQFESYKRDKHTFEYIPQGASCEEARMGVDLLAEQIKDYSKNKPLNVLIPSGTGITFCFLREYFERNANWIHIFTVPCVSESIVKQTCSQFTKWHNIDDHVIHSKYKVFAKPRRQLYSFWKLFHESYGVELDLIYAPNTFLSFGEYISATREREEIPWLYFHTGGVTGNVSQLHRYKRNMIKF